MSRQISLPDTGSARGDELTVERAAEEDAPQISPDGRRPTLVRTRTLDERRPSGRVRHDEKITVYVSSDELFALEQARLVLRGEHGLAIDRGRIVREAIAVLLADFDAKGDSSVLVRRLRGD